MLFDELQWDRPPLKMGFCPGTRRGSQRRLARRRVDLIEGRRVGTRDASFRPPTAQVRESPAAGINRETFAKSQGRTRGRAWWNIRMASSLAAGITVRARGCDGIYRTIFGRGCVPPMCDRTRFCCGRTPSWGRGCRFLGTGWNRENLVTFVFEFVDQVFEGDLS